ncbi:MAG TPA: O-antigen ligase family protein, partial [Blastocatellia bacterium]|nr:O-antigen ligase family protein [Blastocatellia bacterium]
HFLALMLIGLAAFKYSRHPSLVSLPRSQLVLLLTLAAFLTWQLASLSWAPNIGLGLRDASLWFGLIVFLFVGLWVLNERAAFWLQYLLAAISFTLSITQTIKYLHGYEYPSVFFNYGMTAEILAMLLPLQLATYLSTERRGLALVSYLSVYLNALALVQTLRRGPIIGLVLAIAFIGLLLIFRQMKMLSWHRLLALVAPVFLAAVIFLSGAVKMPHSLAVIKERSLGEGWTNLKQRARDMVLLDSSADGINPSSSTSAAPETTSLTKRLRFWVIAWEMAKHHPWRGVGVAGYMAQYMHHRRYYLHDPDYARVRQSDNSSEEWGAGGNAHNEYLQLLAELGIIGGVIFLAFWGQIIWRLWRHRSGPYNYLVCGVAAGLIAFCVSSAVSSFSFRQAPSTVVAICLMVLGMTKLTPRKKSAETDEPVTVTLSKASVVIALCLTTALSLVFTWWAYSALQSQRWQGSADLQFSPTDPSRNEAWLAEYQRALSYDPYNYGAHFGSGLLLYQMKRPQEAIPHIEAAIRLSYGRPFSHVLLAFCQEQTGQLDKATASLEECLAAFPDSPLARIVYIEFLRKKGDFVSMRREQEILRQRDETLLKLVPFIMQMKPTVAIEEARKQGLPPPYDLVPDQLGKAMLPMRTFHYLP